MALAALSGSADNRLMTGKMAQLTRQYVAGHHKAPLVKVHGFAAAAVPLAAADNSIGANAAAALTPNATMQGEGYGFLYDEDGNVWYYTQNTTYRDSQYNACISQAVISVYDQDHKQAGTITIDVPDSMDVNRVDPYGTITKKFFDLNDKTKELLVELHQVGNASNNYQGAYYTRAYHIGDGTLAQEINGAGVFLNVKKNSWSKYQRLVVSNAVYEAVEGKTDADGNDYYTTNDYISVYKPASWGTGPSVEHTFVVDEDYTYYGNDGTPLQVFNVDNTPYYMVSHYEKQWLSGYDESTYDPVPTEDNHLLIMTYDEKFNLVDSLAIPVEKAEDTNFPMAVIGNFGDKTLTKNYFSNDGNLAYVVTFFDYVTSHDDYRYRFVAYDHQGNKIGDVCDGVYDTWFDLKAISGAEDQMAFMQYTSDETSQQLRLVNLPSLTEAVVMPAEIDGNLISTVLNRYGSKDNFKYLMKLSQGDVDDDGNVIARVAWLNQDLTVDHYTKFNLGPNAENFGMPLTDTYVDPYLFDTSDKLEFCYMAKVKDAETSKLNTVFVVADEDGNVIHTFNNSENGTASSAGCYAATDTRKEFYVQYNDTVNNVYNLEFYQLPLVKFAQGGDGTAANPYLVATAGDLAAIKDAPAACYRVVNNIDLANYNLTNDTWNPIANFSGSVDGDNYTIANLHLASSASSVGLFGDLAEKAHISNLVINKPQIDLADNNSFVGVVAATAVTDTIQNVHVTGATISGTSQGTIGGLVGQAALQTYVASSSFNQADINAADAINVGAIAGDIRTSTTLAAVAASNINISADRNLGGIVGSAMQSAISDAHVSNATLAANNTVGGIVGSNSSTSVDKCIFDGSVTASQARWSGLSAAGIVGSLSADWSGSTTAIITNNIAKGSVNVAEGTDADATMHRIVGYSIANEDDCDETEQRLASNYAIGTMTVAGQTVASDDATSVEGKSIDLDTITTAALEGLGYAYGDSTAAPWNEVANALPVLYFEQSVVAALSLSDSRMDLPVDSMRTLVASVYGASADDVEVTSSDDEVVEVNAIDINEDNAVITLKGLKAGTATVTVTMGRVSVTCQVNVVAASGISTPAVAANGRLAIVPQQGAVTAEGAQRLEAYTLSGSRVASVSGQRLATDRLGKGIFVVVATAANGAKTAAKVIVK